jgi:hypothetical protein
VFLGYIRIVCSFFAVRNFCFAAASREVSCHAIHISGPLPV